MSVQAIGNFFDNIVTNAAPNAPGKIRAALDAKSLEAAIGTKLDEVEEGKIDTYMKTVTFGAAGDKAVAKMLAAMPHTSTQTIRGYQERMANIDTSISMLQHDLKASLLANDLADAWCDELVKTAGSMGRARRARKGIEAQIASQGFTPALSAARDAARSADDEAFSTFVNEAKHLGGERSFYWQVSEVVDFANKALALSNANYEKAQLARVFDALNKD